MDSGDEQAPADLQAREERFRLLSEAAREGVAIQDRGRILAVNTAFAEMLGYRPEELVGMQPLELAAPESRELIAHKIASGDEQPYEAIGLRRDGSRLVAELCARSFVFEGRKVRVTTFRDISSRKRAENALAEAERRLRTVIDAAPIVLFAIDEKGVLTLCEGRELRTLGVEPGATGVSLYDVYKHEPEILANLDRALSGEELTVEVSMRSAPLTFETRYVPMRGKDGQVTGVIGVATNITERRRAEKDRDRLLDEEKQARAQAEEALEAREEFLSIASHELNSPLTSLKLRLQEVARSANVAEAPLEPERLRRLIEVSERQLRRLSRLVADLLDVSRITTGQLTLEREELDLGELAREAAARVIEQARPELVAIEVRAELPVHGRWDRVRVEQVVTNLLSNALKYGGGAPVVVTVENAGDRARVTVEDRGIGIAPEMQARLFQRFGRGVSARRYGGLGLGLYIVRQILDAHGGTVRVESTLGQGSRFTVELPR